MDAQYKACWTSDVGSSIRECVVNTLLSLQCCPITNRIRTYFYFVQMIVSERVTRADPEPRQNLLIKRRTNDAGENGFVWSDICRLSTDVLKYDTNWAVIKACLERLGKILENMSFVRTADKHLVSFLFDLTFPFQVNNLCTALVNLYQRAENKEIDFPKSERHGIKNMDYPAEEDLSKYLPPVLAILVISLYNQRRLFQLNYTSLYHSGDNRNNDICRVLVDCVDSDHLEVRSNCHSN